MVAHNWGMEAKPTDSIGVSRPGGRVRVVGVGG
jgi:hypothetical protein